MITKWYAVRKPSVVVPQREEQPAKLFMSKILVVTREIPVLIMNHVGTEEKAEERGQVGRHGTLLQGLFWCHYPLKSGQVIINVCTNTHTHTERQGASLFLRVLTGTVSKSQL